MLLPKTSYLKTPPTGDVVTLEEFQIFVGLGNVAPQYDPRGAAVEKVEDFMKRKILLQQWEFSYDCLSEDFQVQKGLLKSLDNIEVYQLDGSSEVVDAGDYEVQLSTEYLSRVLLLADSWPSTDKLHAGYKITATVGWDDKTKVPPGIKQAVNMVASEMYSNANVQVEKMPEVMSLLNQWRIRGL